MLKLPEGIHSAAWKEMFDAFLRERAEQTGEPFKEFTRSNYDRYVDGRPHLDGVRTFLAARGIEPIDELVRRPGDRKNELVLKLIRERGVEVYESSIDLTKDAQREGLRRAVVSLAEHGADVVVDDLSELIER